MENDLYHDPIWQAEVDEAVGVKPPVRYAALVDVHTLLLHEGRILLLRRANTGFGDGAWSLPCGRLRSWESLPRRAAREIWETTRVAVAETDLEFAHVAHHRGSTDRIGFFFAATVWHGEPVNAEPHEHDAVEWFDLERLPPDLLPYSAAGIEHYRRRRPFSLHNWYRS